METATSEAGEVASLVFTSWKEVKTGPGILLGQQFEWVGIMGAQTATSAQTKA